MTDDDGGVGQATMTVHVVQVQNAKMENGFRLLPGRGDAEAKVANEWFPYAANFPSLDPKALEQPRDARFLADEFVVRDGQRAQEIRFRGTIQAGIYQQICANPGWCYELSGSYHLPAGGYRPRPHRHRPFGRHRPLQPPASSGSKGQPATSGAPSTSRLMAQARSKSPSSWAVSSATAARTGCSGTALPSARGNRTARNQCKPEPEPCEEICIDFNDLPKPHVYTAPFGYKSLTITPLGQTVRAQDLGDPAGQLKLVFPREGVRVDFPVPLTELELTVNNYAGRTLRIVIFDDAAIIQDFVAVVFNEVRTLTLSAPQMTAIAVMGGDNEAAIVRLCTCLDPEIVRKIRAEA